MSQLRQRFRVAWDDGPEVFVTTSARDVAAVQKYLPVGPDGKVDVTQTVEADPTVGFRLVHAALIRKGEDVPTEFDTFLDMLDECEALDPVPSSPNPTKRAHSGRRP